MIVDELEKAGTRSDYGRLWDAMLGLLEPETSRRYPYPALQAPLDLSHVSYIATANSADPLPAPLRDRLRIIDFPLPTLDDIDALFPPVIDDLARGRGVDARWAPPLTGGERELVSAYWTGGSVRALKRVVEVVLTERERHEPRH
jgi:ATP-dependent Lon protease